MLRETHQSHGPASLHAVFAPRAVGSDPAPAPRSTMRVTKRNGSSEPVDVNKIVRAVSRSCEGLLDVDALRVAMKTISGLYDGATTRELDQLSIQTAAEVGLVNARLAEFVAHSARKLNDAIETDRDREFEYFGLRTVYDRYLLKDPKTRLVIETPQHFFLRVACACPRRCRRRSSSTISSPGSSSR